MPKTVKIELGDEAHHVPRLKVGQVEELAELWAKPGRDSLQGAALIADAVVMGEIVFRHADPPVGDIREIACSIPELQAAIAAVLRLSRLGVDAEPGKAPAGESPAA